MGRALVSIIIPVYNSEDYLDECMGSVRKQTFSGIEIICVDDGSTDSCPDKLDYYADIDSRIQVIHKANSGYGDSVNIGIKRAEGEYIGIVEPDDYIDPKMMKTLYFTAKQYDLDLVSSDYKWFFDEGDRRVYTEHSIYESKDIYNRVFCPREQEGAFLGNYINPAGLFKRQFLLDKEIRHNVTPGAAFQDRGFCFLTLFYAKRIMVLPESFYYYRHDNPNSSIARSGDVGIVINEYRLTGEELLNRAEEMNTFMPELLRREYGSCKYAIDRCKPEQRKECINKIWEEFSSYEQEGRLDLREFPENQKKELLSIINDPEQYLKSFEDLRESIHKKLEPYTACIIYGAGVLGKRIYDEMCRDDRLKVKAFSVTNKNKNQSFYKECSVREIDEFISEKESLAVIVGVTEGYQLEIINILEQKGFKHLIIPKLQ